MEKIYIDPGHGGRDSGATGNGLKEKDLCLELAVELDKQLQGYNCETKLAREKDVYVDNGDRAREANRWGADLYYSIHVNGHSNKDANGYEDFIHPDAPQSTQDIRKTIHRYNSRVWTEAGRRDRGRKTANFQVLRETRMPAVLVEQGFITNGKDAELLKNENFKQKLVEAMIKGIVVALNLEGDMKKTPILGEPQATVHQAKEWAKERDAHQRFIDIAPVYWEIGQEIGIRPEVAYCQSAKETAFGRYGGVVSPEANNWAGIKIREGGPNSDPDAHEKFDTPEDGVRAHFNHLAAYVGLNPIGEPHGRYHTVMTIDWAGTIRYVEEFGGRWAPSEEYGKSIVNDYLNGLLNTEPPEEDGEEEEDWKHNGLNWMVENGYIKTPEYWLAENRLDKPLPAWAWFMILKNMKEG